MNKFNNKNLEKNLNNSKTIQIYPLKMTVKTKTNQIKKSAQKFSFSHIGIARAKTYNQDFTFEKLQKKKRKTANQFTLICNLMQF